MKFMKIVVWNVFLGVGYEAKRDRSRIIEKKLLKFDSDYRHKIQDTYNGFTFGILFDYLDYLGQLLDADPLIKSYKVYSNKADLIEAIKKDHEKQKRKTSHR